MKRTGKMPLGFRLPRQPLECCRVGDSPGILSKGEAAGQPAELCGDAHLVQAEFCLRVFGESSNLLFASSVSQQSGIFQIIASCVQSRKTCGVARPPGGQSRDTGCLYPLKIINKEFFPQSSISFPHLPKTLIFFPCLHPRDRGHKKCMRRGRREARVQQPLHCGTGEDTVHCVHSKANR